MKDKILEMKKTNEGVVMLIEGIAGLGIAQLKNRLIDLIKVRLNGMRIWEFLSGSGDPHNDYELSCNCEFCYSR